MSRKYRNSPHVIIHNNNNITPGPAYYGGNWGSEGGGFLWFILSIIAICWVATHWAIIGVFCVSTGAAWILLTLWDRRRTRVKKLSDRASRENDLFLSGDPRGVYGTYTGAQDVYADHPTTGDKWLRSTGLWPEYDDGMDHWK